MYGMEPFFWTKLFLVLAIFVLLSFCFNVVMRKLLKVKKRKFFSYNHLNDKHKTIDLTVRVAAVVMMLIGFSIAIKIDPMERIWFLEPYFFVFIFIFASETVRAFMEWKYSSNKNDYIFTIAQMLFHAIFLLSMFTTNFWGLFG
ncbi:DUF4181 domain-containing protein [Sporosarcina sp. FSL K6-2383]|uniref:DUF4181 domain-containing protein n=1 Tax=Sporosarcina sp. FSL K6-2383 TaxID=2921556 RepID=UPI00315A4E7F